jgi:hypothetical protein
VSAFVADEADDLAARARGCVSADYYGISWIPTAGPTLAAAWMFRHQPPLGHSPERGWTYGNRGQVDLALLYQTETGGRWMRLPGQPDWLAADDAPHWARGSLYAASHALDVGDETWLYFTGTPELHGWAGAGVELRAFRDRLTADGGFARIGRLSWPRHRLLGYTAGLTEWVHLTAVEESDAEPPGLRLNLVTSPRGRLRVALLDGDGNAVEGFGLDDCDGFAGDHLQRTITWRGSPQLPGREVAADLTARVEIEDGTLFAFSFGRS